jgi:hypothetical protein
MDGDELRAARTALNGGERLNRTDPTRSGGTVVLQPDSIRMPDQDGHLGSGPAATNAAARVTLPTAYGTCRATIRLRSGLRATRLAPSPGRDEDGLAPKDELPKLPGLMEAGVETISGDHSIGKPTATLGRWGRRLTRMVPLRSG